MTEKLLVIMRHGVSPQADATSVDELVEGEIGKFYTGLGAHLHSIFEEYKIPKEKVLGVHSQTYRTELSLKAVLAGAFGLHPDNPEYDWSPCTEGDLCAYPFHLMSDAGLNLPAVINKEVYKRDGLVGNFRDWAKPDVQPELGSEVCVTPYHKFQHQMQEVLSFYLQILTMVKSGTDAIVLSTHGHNMAEAALTLIKTHPWENRRPISGPALCYDNFNQTFGMGRHMELRFNTEKPQDAKLTLYTGTERQTGKTQYAIPLFSFLNAVQRSYL